ncbi:MAG TPA: phytanoyl-CoA dioxygenase family protein [Armatimonadota bacterium]|nr:phytanoyl-CoA dioxygenase family protein [Armatimonadota bacterium]
MLTTNQIRQYHNDGYTIHRRALTGTDLAGLREHVDYLLANLPAGQRPEHQDMPHLRDPYLFRMCSHPALLDLVQQIIGPDIVLFSSHLIAKAKGDGLEVPWHQDAEYWELEPMDVVTLWLAVDESVVENGCMRVIPGTQTLGPITHFTDEHKEDKVLDRGLDITRFDLNAAVNIELQPGDCSFHTPYIVHGSTPNRSQKRRCGYTLRFMPASTKLVRDGAMSRFWKDHPVFLVRGEDTAGVNRYEVEAPSA